MKLLLQVTLYYLIITLIVFGFGGVMTYRIFELEVQRETDRYLKSRLWSIQNSIENGESPYAFNSANISIREVDMRYPESKYVFSDTLAEHPSPRIDALEPHRKLTVVRRIQGKNYKVEIFDVIFEQDDILEGVFQSQTRLFIILGAVLVMASFLVSTWVFRPFNVTLQALKNFRLNDPREVILGTTTTREFKELNDIIRQMVEKNKNDYKSLKEFSENASHEMQTPLAVAKGKIELLLQSKNLDQEQLSLINSAYSSINHLSKMSRSLSLLTKIDNNEFANLLKIDFSKVVLKAVFDFKELISLNAIDLQYEVEDNVMIVADPVLAQILVTNLFQNAIRHNIARGHIRVDLQPAFLEISNSGKPLKTDPESLFKRFKKDNQSGETIGLGLAIVKKYVK
ncbi:MAG: HAMP domain-containing histidine kinase [Cyclobacteriaceae bacterium]|nr:HAMP domain-containing histidine kinase [Cyclobacteriaceae bacterium]